ncbi:MAG: hypothetical protein J5529_07960 [Prevotella sp.]|nr:hypothetical protein [Prevotella sp.]
MAPPIVPIGGAIKRILRDKAKFEVLEGLMTLLIGEKMKIPAIVDFHAP